MPQLSYADCFWGGDLSSTSGKDVIAQRNAENKKICGEFEEYLRKRAKLESEYSKQLFTLSKCIKHRDEIGMLETSMNTLKAEIENMSNVHAGASQLLSKQAESLKQFKDIQIVERKAAEDELNKAHNSKVSLLAKAIQQEKAYRKKGVERDSAEIAVIELDTASVTQKDIDKAHNKVAKLEDEFQKADTSYQSSIKALEDSRVIWEFVMRNVCCKVEELDREKIKYLRQELWLAANVDSKLALDVDKSCENIRQKLEKCDVSCDINSFVEHAATGQDHPDPYEYKNYTKISPDSDSGSNEGVENAYSTINHSDKDSNHFGTINSIKSFHLFGKKKK